MSRIMSKTFGKKLSFGRLSMPVWLVAAAGLAVVAAAGQAVGPVLAGSVTGTASVVAQQSVRLGGGSSVTGAPGDSLVVENDEGTSFTAAIETHVGQTGVKLNLDVKNFSNADASAVLELNVPAGIDVEVDSNDSDLKEAQMGPGTWLLKIDAGEQGDLEITIEPKDDAKPGFYTITGRIVQISG
jgi:hypothetical protein